MKAQLTGWSAAVTITDTFFRSVHADGKLSRDVCISHSLQGTAENSRKRAEKTISFTAETMSKRVAASRVSVIASVVALAGGTT